MPISAPEIKALIAEELKQISNVKALEHIKAHLAEPRLVMRKWGGRKPRLDTRTKRIRAGQ
ncbi:MAG: hypothetical protein ACAI35_27140 [Candidatus Methylacidiphilales bacterium]|nr:hypothetical protein [Candidatus Methylacidiphilales bacterium]